MFQPSPIRCVTLFILLAGLGACRENQGQRHKNGSIEQESVTDIKGISLGEQSMLNVAGNTHELRFRWFKHNDGDWCETSLVKLCRLGSRTGAKPLAFPESFRLHEQQFEEEGVTYFLTTGFVARKGLFFHRMRCDHPGALNVKASLSPHHGVDAKSIIQNSPSASQLWLLPFEAEVINDQNSLVIEGEGEILLLWHLNDNRDPANSWQTLCLEYDPGGVEELDLTVVANALEKEAAKIPD